MRAILVMVLVVLSASVVSAQRVERSINLYALGWGRLDRPMPIETDGNLSTLEWLVRDLDTERVRVVTDTPFCAGPWFDPRPSPFDTVTLERHGLVHKLHVFNVFIPGAITIVSLDTPQCPR